MSGLGSVEYKKRGIDIRRQQCRADDLTDRMVRSTLHLCSGNCITIAWLQSEYSLSRATAKRDFSLLQYLLPLSNTKGIGPHGGVCAELRLLPTAQRQINHGRAETRETYEGLSA